MVKDLCATLHPGIACGSSTSQDAVLVLITGRTFGHCLFYLYRHIWLIHNTSASCITLHDSKVRLVYFAEHFMSELLWNNELIGLE